MLKGLSFQRVSMLHFLLLAHNASDGNQTVSIIYPLGGVPLSEAVFQKFDCDGSSFGFSSASPGILNL